MPPHLDTGLPKSKGFAKSKGFVSKTLGLCSPSGLSKGRILGTPPLEAARCPLGREPSRVLPALLPARLPARLRGRLPPQLPERLLARRPATTIGKMEPPSSALGASRASLARTASRLVFSSSSSSVAYSDSDSQSDSYSSSPLSSSSSTLLPSASFATSEVWATSAPTAVVVLPLLSHSSSGAFWASRAFVRDSNAAMASSKSRGGASSSSPPPWPKSSSRNALKIAAALGVPM
mmetsp:Transcript_56194/g.157696  ORF Transcript_56194/g.157696 Transcript_56194/m.157696 type:complete len:235 (+) Transcript_56194:119-823(+)